MTSNRPSATEPLVRMSEACVVVAAAATISAVSRVAMQTYPALVLDPSRRWGSFDAVDLQTGNVFAVVVFLFFVFRMVPRWAAKPESVRLSSSRTIAVVSSLALFGEHWMQGRLNSVTAPVNLFLWSGAVAVGIKPFIDRAETRWPKIDRTTVLYFVFLLAAFIQSQLQDAWQIGLKAVATPMISMGVVDKAWLAISFFGPPLVVGSIMWAVFFYKREFERSPIGKISMLTRSGYPVLTWSQVVGTNQSLASPNYSPGVER